MIILGIDPGTRITGYGVINIDGNKINCIEFGVIKNNQKCNSWECHAKIFEGLQKIIRAYAINEVAVESQFFFVNAKTALKIGEARSIALLPASLSGIPIVEYSPTHIKKAVVGTGTAKKEQVQFMMSKILNLKNEFEYSDAADALAIAVCHAHSLRFSNIGKKL